MLGRGGSRMVPQLRAEPCFENGLAPRIQIDERWNTESGHLAAAPYLYSLLEFAKVKQHFVDEALMPVWNSS